MNDDDREDREAILRRRARLVAAALAGLATASGCDSHPAPCLSPPPDPERDAGGAPTSSASAPVDAGAPDPHPQPCLSPMPCLSVTPDPEPSASVPPMPCLAPPTAPPPPPPDAGPPKPPPHPCLSPKRRP